jgi:3-oxoacyl-[acyl-carrier protein] reductase
MEKSDPFLLFVEGSEYKRTLLITTELVDSFGRLSGDFNPIHVNDAYAKSKGLTGRVSYGNILGMMISALVGEELETKGVMLMSEIVNFRKPVFVGETIDLRAEVTSLSEATRAVMLNLEFRNNRSVKVATGKCQIKIL